MARFVYLSNRNRVLAVLNVCVFRYVFSVIFESPRGIGAIWRQVCCVVFCACSVYCFVVT